MSSRHVNRLSKVPSPVRSRFSRVIGVARTNVPVLKPAPAASNRRGWWIAAGAGGLLAVLLAVGVVPRWQKSAELAAAEQTTRTAARKVNVTLAQQAGGGEIGLPATLQAYQWADLHARVNGYLKNWSADIGARDKAGDVLAEIDTPELDQELNQAVALLKQGESELRQAQAELEEARAELTLAQANTARSQANLVYAEALLKRNRALVGSYAIARQDWEETQRSYAAQKAQLAADQAEAARRQTNLATRTAIIEGRQATVSNRQANVQRLRDVQSFQRITAPFDGIVTRRTAEVGTLVTAGGTNGKPLFSIAQADLLRVQVAVPQTHAAGVRVGDPFQVTVPELANQIFPAKVARTANAVDPASRTLLVELELANADYRLLPGTYARITLQTRQDGRALLAPANVLLLRNDGPHVAVVGGNGNVRLEKVNLGRDFGITVEVLSGLQGHEVLIVNPTDDLRNGDVVEVINQPTVQVASGGR